MRSCSQPGLTVIEPGHQSIRVIGFLPAFEPNHQVGDVDVQGLTPTVWFSPKPSVSLGGKCQMKVK